MRVGRSHFALWLTSRHDGSEKRKPALKYRQLEVIDGSDVKPHVYYKIQAAIRSFKRVTSGKYFAALDSERSEVRVSKV